MVDWTGLITNGVWAALGAGGAYFWRRCHRWWKSRGHGALFAGLGEPTLFVFPPRPGPGKLLPQTAIEDFLAINNIISAYIRIGMEPPHKMRDHHHFSPSSDGKNNNLILICSSKSNNITEQAINQLRGRNSRWADLIPYFESVPGKPDRIQIKWNQGTWESPSYEQTGPRLDDVAIIIKARNPWAEQHKILIVAGIRGIGTWGAAEKLKKWWEDIYEKKGSSRRRGTSKQGEFAAIVRIHYEDHDIKDATLIDMVDLDCEYSR